MSRNEFNWVCGAASVVAALASLAIACQGKPEFGVDYQQLGKVIVAGWVLVPPIFFWIDWVVFGKALSHEQKEALKHTHDLSRNIWLGLVAVLALAFQLTECVVGNG